MTCTPRHFAADDRPLRLSQYVVVSEPFSEDGGAPSRIVLATRTGVRLKLGEALWRQLDAGGAAAIPPAIRARLADAGVLVAADADELTAVLDENRRAIASDSTLSRVIQPSAFCQLGCGYCGQSHARKQMSPADRERLVARIAAAIDPGRHTRMHIGWFGAEPLAGIATMRALSPRLQSAAALDGPGGVSIDTGTGSILIANLALANLDLTDFLF